LHILYCGRSRKIHKLGLTDPEGDGLTASRLARTSRA
jgi:hypothetical protein